jgi:hypothetical protein
MTDPLSATEQERRKRERAAIRDRELRRYAITLGTGILVYAALNQFFPPGPRGPAFIGLLVLGLVLAFVLGQLVDRIAEQRRLRRATASRGRQP